MGSGFGRDILVGRLIVAIGESSREIEQRVAESSISNEVNRVCLRTCVRVGEKERGGERESRWNSWTCSLPLTTFAALSNKNIKRDCK